MTFPLHTQKKHAGRDAPSRRLGIMALAALAISTATAWQSVRARHMNPASARGSLAHQDASNGIAEAHRPPEFVFAPTARIDPQRDRPGETQALSAEETSLPASANAGAPAPPPSARPERAQPRALSDVLASWASAATNPDFTQEMKSYLEETARAVNLDPRLVDSAECRGNICRVKLVFATPQSALAFQEAANPSPDYTVYLAGADQMDPAIRPGTSPALDVTIERALPPTAANARSGSEP